MLMVPKSARAHSIKSRMVPKSAVACERVKGSLRSFMLCLCSAFAILTVIMTRYYRVITIVQRYTDHEFVAVYRPKHE